MHRRPKEYEFSVTLDMRRKVVLSFENSVANAAKPLVYFAALFGLQTIRYMKESISKTNITTKLYGIMLIALIVLSLCVFKPGSWKYTQTDLPLHMLTKTFSILAVLEVAHSIFIMSFGNSSLYVKIFTKLDDINIHFGTSRKMFMKIRTVSAFLALVPILMVSGTFWLIKFNIANIGQHFVYFMIMLQGAIIVFLILQIYSKQLILNSLLIKKLGDNVPMGIMTERLRTVPFIVQSIFVDLEALEIKANKRTCWFELMQIYDKISDCILFFNRIYARQIFMMFVSWFVCTLLTICRSLSPSVKYSEVIVNDLFMYASINARPIFLAKMCEFCIIERKKTISILLHNLVHQIDKAYQEQIQTMLDLVESREILVTGHVFTANVATVLEFAGRSISYTVLMIQYFYMHVFRH